MNITQLAAELRQFAQARDWDQFHTPKNLAISLTVEAAELLELFQWSKGSSSWVDLEDPKLRARASQELADVLLYLVRFADLAGIDLEKAAEEKLVLNAAKYPVEKCRGSDRKYDEL
jgi:dCTP diphosphatase